MKLKDKEEFEPTFIKAKFVGNAIVFLITNNIKDKDKVYIKSGALKSNAWTTKEGTENKVLELTVFELDFAHEKTSPVDDKQVNRFKR